MSAGMGEGAAAGRDAPLHFNVGRLAVVSSIHQAEKIEEKRNEFRSGSQISL